jgi:hypothetical protein
MSLRKSLLPILELGVLNSLLLIFLSFPTFLQVIIPSLGCELRRLSELVTVKLGKRNRPALASDLFPGWRAAVHDSSHRQPVLCQS